MPIRFLLDTHVLIRWLTVPEKLSRDQARVLDRGLQPGEQIGISGVSLLEMSLLVLAEKLSRDSLKWIFDQLDTNPIFRVFPLSIEIAREFVALGEGLRDPMDKTIVSTARVHRLELLTSDQRIIDSQLASVIE